MDEILVEELSVVLIGKIKSDVGLEHSRHARFRRRIERLECIDRNPERESRAVQKEKKSRGKEEKVKAAFVTGGKFMQALRQY